MMWIYALSAVVLAIAAVLILIRMVLGPTTLNRTVAVDMFVAALIGGIGIHAAVTRSATALPILVVLALVGSLGSVSIAKFVGKDDREDVQ